MLRQIEDSQGMALYFKQMNAIARGVEAKLESLDGHSETVTQGTIKVARGLVIPEKAVQRWSAARERLMRQRQQQMESLLARLKHSPLAQVCLGMTDLHVYEPDGDDQRN